MRFFSFFIFSILTFCGTQADAAVTLGTVGIRPGVEDVEGVTRDRLQYTIQPGGSISDVVDVVNNTDDVARVRMYSVDSTQSSDGTFAVEQASEQRDAIGAWITLAQNEVEIAPHSTMPISFSLIVPESISSEQREYQGGIMLEHIGQSTTTESGGIQLSTRTGVRVYVTIPGDIQQSAQITRFSVGALPGDPRTLDVTISIRNTGNVTQDLTIVTESDMSSAWERLIAFQQFPARTELRVQVLPGQTLTRHQTITRPWAGVLNVQAHVIYETNTGATSFVAEPVAIVCLPPWYVLVCLVMYIAFFLYAIIRRSIRKHIEHVVREHVQRSKHTK
ncbi:MAG: hypothetical protein KIH62_004200 [Candidatus Kerfeldbacteria bacterium]|nr:hypothetical protein [Candidatus Kerfeldbacteria bacterium]